MGGCGCNGIDKEEEKRPHRTRHDQKICREQPFRTRISKHVTSNLCNGGSDNIAADTLLGGGLLGVDGHTEVTREHGGDLGDGAVLEVILGELGGLDGASAVLVKSSLALVLRDLLKKRADIRIAAAADLAEAGNLDPAGGSHLLLDENFSRSSVDVLNDLNVIATNDVITLLDGHLVLDLSLLDDDVVGLGVTAVGDGEVDGVKLLKRLHLPGLDSAHGDKNKSSKDKSTHLQRFMHTQKTIKKR